MGANISTTVTQLGFATSNYPAIYRDGGGGGTVNGLNLMWFSDGIYTDGTAPKDNLSNWRNFTSNSIAVSGYLGAPIQSLTDFGNAQKGPRQQIPYYYNNGETDQKTGIWPNQNLVTLCDGGCAVSFPLVVNRTAANANSLDINLYNTPVKVDVGAYGPTVTRPTRALFYNGEPLYGTYCSYYGIDGYLYTFAKITGTNSNGLKVARVPWNSYADRSQYRYWNGSTYVATMPSYDDRGKTNAFNWTETGVDGKKYGPGYGEIFYSQVYKMYIMLFQPDDAGFNHDVYLSYSNYLEKDWSTPSSIWTLPTFSDGYTYSFHAYPNMDPTGRSIPITWNQFSTSRSYIVGMANITFT